jgi:hypothetical protein
MIGISLDLEGSGSGLIKVISRELSDVSEENHQNTLVKIFSDLAENRKGNPLATSSIFPSACWVQRSVEWSLIINSGGCEGYYGTF